MEIWIPIQTGAFRINNVWTLSWWVRLSRIIGIIVVGAILNGELQMSLGSSKTSEAALKCETWNIQYDLWVPFKKKLNRYWLETSFEVKRDLKIWNTFFSLDPHPSECLQYVEIVGII